MILKEIVCFIGGALFGATALAVSALMVASGKQSRREENNRNE